MLLLSPSFRSIKDMQGLDVGHVFTFHHPGLGLIHLAGIDELSISNWSIYTIVLCYVFFFLAIFPKPLALSNRFLSLSLTVVCVYSCIKSWRRDPPPPLLCRGPRINKWRKRGGENKETLNNLALQIGYATRIVEQGFLELPPPPPSPQFLNDLLMWRQCAFIVVAWAYRESTRTGKGANEANIYGLGVAVLLCKHNICCLDYIDRWTIDLSPLLYCSLSLPYRQQMYKFPKLRLTKLVLSEFWGVDQYFGRWRHSEKLQLKPPAFAPFHAVHGTVLKGEW